MKYISDKSEVFEKVDSIYKKLRYQRRGKNKIQGKEIWEELYEAIPYRYILENEDILDLVVNICKDNYKENLSLLKKLISECEEIKYYYTDEVINKEEKDDKPKQKIELRAENKKYEKKEVNTEKYWIDFDWDKKVIESESNKSTKQLDNYYSKIKKNYMEQESFHKKDLIKNRYSTKNIKGTLEYKLEKTKGKIKPYRREIKINKIIRNYNIVQALKKIYKDTCQICGTRLEIAPYIYYSEVHHIRPLGKLHGGSDTIDNGIVLCPNCHTLFDKGSIKIDLDKSCIVSFNKNNRLNGLKVEFKHEINKENIKYHNNKIYVGQLSDSAKKQDNIEMKIQYKSNNNKIDYKDIVEILDLDSNNIIIIDMKSYWEQNDMSPLQKKLLNKNIGDIVKFNEYKYKITKINKRYI